MPSTQLDAPFPSSSFSSFTDYYYGHPSPLPGSISLCLNNQFLLSAEVMTETLVDSNFSNMILWGINGVRASMETDACGTSKAESCMAVESLQNCTHN